MSTERGSGDEKGLVNSIRLVEAVILTQDAFDQSSARMLSNRWILSQLLYLEYAGQGLEQLIPATGHLVNILRDQQQDRFQSTREFLEAKAISCLSDYTWIQGLSDEDYQPGGRANLPQKLRQMAAAVVSN